MGEHGPLYEQGDLFRDPKDVEDPKTAALRVAAEIAARRAEATQIEGDPLPEAAADEPIATTSQKRVAAQAEEILARVRRDAAEVNSGVSPARAAETSDNLVSPEASAEGERQTTLARLAVAEAAEKARIEEALPAKEARIEAAKAGAGRSRQVLEAIQQDMKKTPLDKARERTTKDLAKALDKLEIAKAEFEAAQGRATVVQDARYRRAQRRYGGYLLVLEDLDRLIAKAAQRSEEPEVGLSGSEASDLGEKTKTEWPKDNLIHTREEAIRVAKQLAEDANQPSGE